MKYLIGEASKLVGISNETIRYYEREGAIHSVKDEATGYRYYSALDISVLMRVRMYRNCGYSLPEIENMLNHCGLEELDECLLQKQQALEEQILWCQHVKRQFVRMRSALKRIPLGLNQCVIEENPPLYRLKFQQEEKISDGSMIRTIMKEWINKMPLAFPSAQFMHRDVLAQNDRYNIGLAIFAQDAQYMGISANEYVDYIPSVPCVHTIIQAKEGRVLSPKYLRHALGFIQENNLTLCGNAFGIGLTSLKKSSTHVRYHQIWLPVTQREEKQ